MRRVIAVLSCSITCTLGAQQAPAPARLDPTVFDAFLGTYEFTSGKLMVIARTERRLYAYEPGSERIRGLERITDHTWIAGPSLLVYEPESYRLTFVEGPNRTIISLKYAPVGQPAELAKKARLYREEEVTFRSGEVALSGTLLIPETKGPYPAIVLGHGSGPQDRNGYVANIRFMADHLARNGIAVLTFDKRGAGRSTGNWATASFADLARDLVSGIDLLKKRPDIIASKVGIGGSSQVGWVAAKAVAQRPDIPFVMLTGAGGSGYTVEQQNLYNTEVEMRAAAVSPDRITKALELQRRFFEMLRRGQGADAREYDEAVRVARQDTVLRNWIFPLSTEVDWRGRTQWFTALEVDFDPLPIWRGYAGAVLGVFGELDAQTPVAEVVPRFTAALLNRTSSDFTIAVFPKASHLMMEATRPSDDELEHLTRMVPGYYQLVAEWLLGRLRRIPS